MEHHHGCGSCIVWGLANGDNIVLGLHVLWITYKYMFYDICTYKCKYQVSDFVPPAHLDAILKI